MFAYSSFRVICSFLLLFFSLIFYILLSSSKYALEYWSRSSKILSNTDLFRRILFFTATDAPTGKIGNSFTLFFALWGEIVFLLFVSPMIRLLPPKFCNYFYFPSRIYFRCVGVLLWERWLGLGVLKIFFILLFNVIYDLLATFSLCLFDMGIDGLNLGLTIYWEH